MVVMEHLKGYKRLEDTLKEERKVKKMVIEDMERALSELHGQDLVHGDFRAANIMINSEGNHAKVIDFDWAAKENVGRYIVSINKEELSAEWHEEVGAGKLMKKAHDEKALDIISGRCNIESMF